MPEQASGDVADAAGDGVVIYRARGLRIGMSVIGVWGQASVTSTILAVPDHPAWQDLLVVAVAAIFFLGVVAYRVGWACIEAHRWGLVVRNPFRRYELPWSQVTGFTAGNFGLLTKVGVQTRTGKTVPVAGLPVSGGKPGGSVAAALAALRAMLERATTIPDRDPGSASDSVAQSSPRGGAMVGGLLLLAAVAAVVQIAGGLVLGMDQPAVWASAATIAYATLVIVVSRPLAQNRNTSTARAGAEHLPVELTMAGAVLAGGGVAGALSNRSAPLIVGVAISAAWIILMNNRKRDRRTTYL